ncbi:MAG: low molecular weight phosphatase family protein [Proteobacteria bacterium]|nr:low molecular weight phosphatase family protein [Pseudomonadota bacterium]
MARLPGSVLFACTQNSIRSPMAEGLLKKVHGKRLFVDSVGVRGLDIDPFAVAVMEEIGVDLRFHRAKTFAVLADSSFDVIVTLSPEAHHRALEMTRIMACEVEYWPTFDPTIVEGSRAARLDAYRAVRDELRRHILARFPPVSAPDM